MARRIVVVAALSAGISSCTPTLVGQTWTNKNNAEESAAYMIRVAYNDRGYMDASVLVKTNGNKQVFEVEPGRIYHIKELRVVGRGGLPAEALAGAPASGEIYSAARMDEWITKVNKHYTRRANWGATYDHAKAEVVIEVRLDPDNSGEPTRPHPSSDH